MHLLILYDLPGSTMFLMCLVFLGDRSVSLKQDWVRIRKGKNSLVIFHFVSADFFFLFPLISLYNILTPLNTTYKEILCS